MKKTKDPNSTMTQIKNIESNNITHTDKFIVEFNSFCDTTIHTIYS